jgi:hypothetical protein
MPSLLAPLPREIMIVAGDVDKPDDTVTRFTKMVRQFNWVASCWFGRLDMRVTIVWDHVCRGEVNSSRRMLFSGLW